MRLVFMLDMLRLLCLYCKFSIILFRFPFSKKLRLKRALLTKSLKFIIFSSFVSFFCLKLSFFVQSLGSHLLRVLPNFIWICWCMNIRLILLKQIRLECAVSQFPFSDLPACFFQPLGRIYYRRLVVLISLPVPLSHLFRCV